MRKFIYSLIFLAAATVIVSCADESLDPYQINKVKKGTILALRGTQLDNIYNLGQAGAEFFPKAITGDEKFEFDAEYLAEDPTTIGSVDVYAIKRVVTPDGTVRERVHLTTVSGSEFKTTADYRNPWVTISIPLGEILDAIEIPLPLDEDEIDVLLDRYQFGINIETDITLKDGSQVLASQIVAAGLFQSDQFYPAQVLTYAVTDYCTYDAALWGGDYDATEASEFLGGYGPYTVTLVQDGGDPNKFTTDNWYDSGIPIYMIFTPSTDVATQIVTVPAQPNPNNPARTISGTGKYNQCLNELSITFEYKQGTQVLDRFLWKLVRPE